MTTNIFEGAKFGDRFRTRNGTMVTFFNNDRGLINGAIPSAFHPCEEHQWRASDGVAVIPTEYNENSWLDIVSRWDEPSDDQSKENLKAILPNVYLVRTQAGWQKLLKKLGATVKGQKPNRDRWYSCSISQRTEDENAFEERCFRNGKKYKFSVQYPIKYPCLISYQDETFDQGSYHMSIRYVRDDLRLTELTEVIEEPE